ncbi:hypothetical protein C2G38_2300344 [Gigaspora rosea]|uniref:TLD-domain-containing protein n=1 Tax=Gigaspora rosea TaxID=44941 RepID=A0A397VHV2_9GLOM|nr:hypothetical protein C2G38_2300344 [Gigaspora rosea]
MLGNNVIINVGNSPDVKTFKTHSSILKYRSLYFRNELSNINNDKNNIKPINLKHISIEQFDIIIKYIYGGVILLENLDTSFIFELMHIACEFILEELAKYLETYLIETKDHWLLSHFANIYQKSFKSDTLQELQKWCNDIIVKYPNKVFDSEDFVSLTESALVSLIKRDDFNNIYNHIYPYKQILEKTLWKNIKKRLASPNLDISSKILPPRTILTQNLPKRTTNLISSSVISEEHATVIASWIDKRTDTYSVANNPYEFKLLLRGSRDGFTKDSFWNLCNKQKNIVVIMKVKGTDEILGGYNPVGWERIDDGAIYRDCNDSFIFSLKNGNNQTVLRRVKKPECSTLVFANEGPAFSYGLYMKNNFNQDNGCYCYFNTNYLTYEPIRSFGFANFRTFRRFSDISPGFRHFANFASFGIIGFQAFGRNIFRPISEISPGRNI